MRSTKKTNQVLAVCAFILVLFLVTLSVEHSIEKNHEQNVGEIRNLRAEVVQAQITIEDVATKPIIIDEKTQCPSTGIDPKIIEQAVKVMVNPANKSKFVYWTNTYANRDHNPDNVQVIYLYKGRRYTVWHTPAESINGFWQNENISVWDRPDGTRGQEDLDTYTDLGVDGCINSGSGGTAHHRENASLLIWNEIGRANTGVENHTLWQRSYLEAMTGLVATLDLH